MDTIKIQKAKRVRDGSPRLVVTTPFHPQFARKARLLGGSWEDANKRWQFDSRDEARVRELCIELFGEDDQNGERRDVRFDLGFLEDSDELREFGRVLAWRRGRDAEVSLGSDVILLSGGFPRSGGSANHPRVACREALVEIRDVPIRMVEKAVERWGERVTVIEPAPSAQRPAPREEEDPLTKATNDAIAWREAAGMLEALLSEIDPAKARGVREMFSCLDWGHTEEDEAEDRRREQQLIDMQVAAGVL